MVSANSAVTVPEGVNTGNPKRFYTAIPSRVVATIPCSDEATPGVDDQNAPVTSVVLFGPACCHVLTFGSPRPRCAPSVKK